MASTHITDAAAGASAPLGFVPDPSQPVAKRLVASYPPGQRGEMAHTFTRMLARYRQLEARFGLAPNDMAGAVAAFVAGNYTAYRDVDFPDEGFLPLVQQMRAVIGGLPQVRGSSNADKQQLYEEMAIVGMHMALQRAELQGGSASARAQLQRTAKTHLEQFLQMDCSGLSIGKHGLGMPAAQG